MIFKIVESFDEFKQTIEKDRFIRFIQITTPECIDWDIIETYTANYNRVYELSCYDKGIEKRLRHITKNTIPKDILEALNSGKVLQLVENDLY